jgi:hypothetical protein
MLPLAPPPHAGVNGLRLWKIGHKGSPEIGCV